MNRSSFSRPRVSPGKSALLAAVIAAVVLGWWLGRRGADSPAASAPVATVPPPPSVMVTSRSKLPSEVQSWISEIEAESLPSAQATTAIRLAARLTHEEWPVLLKHLDRFPSASVRTVLEAAVLRRWAAVDPAEAAAWGLQHYPILAAAAGAEWVRQDLQAAQAWFVGLTPQQRSAGLVQEEFYAMLIQRDSEACFALMLAHESDPRFGMSNWVKQKIAEASPEQALAFAERSTSERLRNSFREEVARAYGKRDPFSAIAWAQQQSDVERMLAGVFRQYQKPPADMIPAFAHLSAEQQEKLREHWSGWERGDPFASLKVLRDAPEGLTEESRRFFAARAFKTLASRYDLPEAVRRLETDWRNYAGMWEHIVATKWASQDPEAARSWIETLPKGEMSGKIWQAYEKEVELREWRQNIDPASSVVRTMFHPHSHGLRHDYTFLNPLTPSQRVTVWEQVSALPEAQRTAAQTDLVSLQAGVDPTEAAAWLTSRPEAPPSPELASRLAANWALDDAPAAARWVGSLPAGEAKTWALWNLTRQWQRVDAQAAQRWAAARSPADKAVMESAFAGRRP